MICQLCNKKEADKKNTHYLTDVIIRTCLNQDGSNGREEGYYVEMSSDSDYVDPNFQRNTSIEKIEESLGRPLDEEEIEKAKQNPCSVDNVFCSDCEDIFTDIENQFIQNILPQFRNKTHSNTTLDIEDSKSIRLFFYLQLWRTHICFEKFQLKESVAKELQQIIMNHHNVGLSQIKKYPLSITYLETLGEAKNYTENQILREKSENPYFIWMNDFVVQFFDSVSEINFIVLFGINDANTYMDYINYNEESFKVKIIHNEERKIVNSKYREIDACYFLVKQQERFINCWQNTFGEQPDPTIVKEYINKIVEGDFHISKYSEERITKIKSDFIYSKI